ncbi:MAG: aspartate-semialdehyde dehydrogenase [Clostridia bacterium]|nr:aspartate-semialdehyde dehydrogenase [Clostridia bacterium]
MRKYKVGVIGATGMVGQRFVTLLENHPWFELAAVAASARSAGKTYEEAVQGRWAMKTPIPEAAKKMVLKDANDVADVASAIDFAFCAIAATKEETRALEEAYAKAETPVVSNNSACRALGDVPMLIPEINWEHAAVIEAQKKRLGTRRGFIAVKPNCSIQSYVPALTSLLPFGPEKIFVCTYQAISGAGKTFETFPQILDNVIPYIGGEEEKSEQEPLKIWGSLAEDKSRVIPASSPIISAQCLRVPVSDGHTAAVSVAFREKPDHDTILKAWSDWETVPQKLGLPSAPKPFIRYMSENDRPQPSLDRDFEKGMGVSVGRLREDRIFDWRFVCLSHNTLRGAAGGGVLSAELLCQTGAIERK